MGKKLTGENILNSMRTFFGNDTRRIKHAEKVFGYAMDILDAEGCDREIVEAAAALHDIGIHEAERKYGSPAGNYQEIEGPPIAEKILEEYDIDSEKVIHICRIIANHHSARDIDTCEFRIIWDADWLVNIPDELNMEDKKMLKSFIARTFKTGRGRDVAEKLFLN